MTPRLSWPSVLCACGVAATALADEPIRIRRELVRSVYLASPRGIEKANALRIQDYTRIRPVTFRGLTVMLHEAAHEPLHCVELALVRCEPYEPKALSGWRETDSYRGREISSHVFGIALDIDPVDNTCCGCLGQWSQVPACAGWKPEDGPGPHALPQCWIDAFEANGWYWLGHDAQLRDTMHFEYLATKGAVHCDG